MTNRYNNSVPHVSPLQCYVCVYNNVGEFHGKRFIPTPSVRCKGCKLQYYCGLKHLVEDTEHHEFCRVVTQLQKWLSIKHPLLLNGKIDTLNLQSTKSQLLLALRVKLGRQLTSRERELIGYPAYCVVCYSLEDLTACMGCAAVAYCSDEHRRWDLTNHTQEICHTLGMYYSPYRLLDSKLEIKQFQQKSDLLCSDLVETFRRATGLQVDSQPWQSLQEYERFAACSSFSGIASVCLALSNISFVATPQKVLNVYVVGASRKHLRYFREMHLKFFFMQYPTVCKLTITFIGPQLHSAAGEEEVSSMKFQGCKRRIVKRTFSMTFEKFAKSNKVDPTLIISYNPDFASIDTVTQRLVERRYPRAVRPADRNNDYDWRCCLREILLTYSVPICFTSPSKMQSRSDITCLKVIGRSHGIAVNCVYNCKENPYREILPLHNPCPDDNETIVYANNYLEVVFTMKQG